MEVKLNYLGETVERRDAYLGFKPLIYIPVVTTDCRKLKRTTAAAWPLMA